MLWLEQKKVDHSSLAVNRGAAPEFLLFSLFGKLVALYTFYTPVPCSICTYFRFKGKTSTEEKNLQSKNIFSVMHIQMLILKVVHRV